MTAISVTNPKPLWKPILAAGLLAGSADLVFALFYYRKGGTNFQGVLQSIAGGLLGKSTYQGGMASAMLGVALHYLIATVWAASYVFASRVRPFLVRYAIPCGLLFGAIIFFFMNMVVLPLSAYHSKVWPPPLAGWVIAIHIFGVGLPIALVARRFQSEA